MQTYSYTLGALSMSTIHDLLLDLMLANTFPFYWSYWFWHALEIDFLRGTASLTKKLAYFALYVKIFNTFVQNNVYILKKIVQGTKKWHALEFY